MAATVTTALPPASPFAKLLRRSRFASFDPQIKQVFSAPPAHAHRGDYGLKRPIPLRRKNSFITLNAPYDAREQFTEWVRGESQVRFIRRFEELDTDPTVPRTSTWYRHQSSKSATEWLADSDFSSVTERPEFTEGLSVQDLMDLAKEEEAMEFDEDLSGLGGKKEMEKVERFVLGTSRLSPNIRAMNEEQFEQFVAKLRKMRPAFRAFINKNYPDLAKKSLFAISQDTISGIHRRFLEEVTFQEFQSINSLKIEPMPHRNGGLLYHHPTPLHSHFFSPMEPGILLQTDPFHNHQKVIRQDGKSPPPGHMVSFAGLRSTIPYIPEGKEVLYDHNSADGMKHWDAAQSVIDMRVVPGTITLHQIPTTVGRNAMGVKGIRMQTHVTDDSAMMENEVRAFPGTYGYASFELEEEEKPESKEDKERKNLMNAPVPLTRSGPPPESNGARGKKVLNVLSKLALAHSRKPLQ